MQTTRMKLLREAGNTSQIQLATELGISQGEVSQIERGFLRPREEVVTALEKHFGYTFAELIMEPTVIFQGESSDTAN